MAHRRMFSKAIVNSTRFMKMPADSQNLYFHLGMAADDDGVVEAWSVLRSIGSAEDNLKVLGTKGFIKVLNEDLVSYITDWNEHNAMRSDRLTPSVYRELLVQIIPDVELVVPTERADRIKRLGRPTDNHGAPQVRLGEDRIINTSVAIAPRIVRVSEKEEKPKEPPKYPHSKEVFKLWEVSPRNWTLNTTQLRAAENLYEERGIEAIQEALQFIKDFGHTDFFPSITSPYDLDSKWAKLEAKSNELAKKQ